jgi:hypothetical protein
MDYHNGQKYLVSLPHRVSSKFNFNESEIFPFLHFLAVLKKATFSLNIQFEYSLREFQ